MMFSEDETDKLKELLRQIMKGNVRPVIENQKNKRLLRKLIDWEPSNDEDIWLGLMLDDEDYKNMKNELDAAEPSDRESGMKLQLDSIKHLRSVIKTAFLQDIEYNMDDFIADGDMKEFTKLFPSITRLLVKKADIDCVRKGSEELPTRLIEVDSGRVVVVDKNTCQDGVYATVSYAWENDEFVQNDKVEWKLPRSANEALEQALQAAKMLDIKWIWMDAFCIKQDDSTYNKQLELAKMASYYKQSVLCIVLLPEMDHKKLGALSVVFENMWTENRVSNTQPPISNMLLVNNMVKDHVEEQNRRFCESLPFVKCRWMSRKWILQELFLSKKLVAFFSNTLIDFDKVLSETAKHLRSTGITSFLQHIKDESYALLAHTAELRTEVLESNYNKCTFAKAVVSASKRKCKVLEDNLQGIMGLMGMVYDNRNYEDLQLQTLDIITQLKKRSDDNTWLQLSTRSTENIAVGVCDFANPVIVNEVMVPNDQYSIRRDDDGKICIETGIWSYGNINKITSLGDIIFDGDDTPETLEQKLPYLRQFLEGQNAPQEIIDNLPRIKDYYKENPMKYENFGKADIMAYFNLLMKYFSKFILDTNYEVTFPQNKEDKNFLRGLQVVWINDEMFVTRGKCVAGDLVVLAECNTVWVVRNDKDMYTRVGCVASNPVHTDKDKLTYIGSKSICIANPANFFADVLEPLLSSVQNIFEDSYRNGTLCKSTESHLSGSRYAVMHLAKLYRGTADIDIAVRKAVGKALDNIDKDDTDRDPHRQPITLYDGVVFSFELAAKFGCTEETKEFYYQVAEHMEDDNKCLELINAVNSLAT